jgi:hypothetical protein
VGKGVRDRGGRIHQDRLDRYKTSAICIVVVVIADGLTRAERPWEASFLILDTSN